MTRVVGELGFGETGFGEMGHNRCNISLRSSGTFRLPCTRKLYYSYSYGGTAS